ncbi:vpu protein [Human immunodeficiency virus 1]|uniref:Protein Vpu n=1 Tax=Human immunodeficiency virus type 1 TaxID=11676 RepID=A0A0U3VBF9_HV1|nr:vpu protein [Human immunodeficiency virus 1]
MHHWELITLIAFSVACLLCVLVWMLVFRLYLEHKKQDRKERELLKRLKRLIEIRDDSDYESNGEEEREVMDLVHSHGFDNPMFEL